MTCIPWLEDEGLDGIYFCHSALINKSMVAKRNLSKNLLAVMWLMKLIIMTNRVKLPAIIVSIVFE